MPLKGANGIIRNFYCQPVRQSIDNAKGLASKVTYPWNLFPSPILLHHLLAVQKVVIRVGLDNVIYSCDPTSVQILFSKTVLNHLKLERGAYILMQ